MLRATKTHTTANKRTNRRKRLQLESLETRRLLAGDVAVQIIDGNLDIRGDALSNLIEVRQASDGTPGIFIRGLASPDGELTTVNGGPETTIDEEFVDVIAAMGRGDDLIYFHDVDLPGNLSVRTQGGNDTVFIGGLPRDSGPLPEPIPGDSVDAALADGMVEPVDPVPILPWANTTIAGNLAIATSRGTDGIAIGSVEVYGNMSINTGGGGDTVRLGVNELPGPAEEVPTEDVDVAVIGDVPGISLPLDVFGSFRLDTGGGNDAAWVESTHVFGDARFNLGGGDDVLSYDWGGVSGRLHVDAGAGNDIVVLAHLWADTIVIRGRSGDDGVGLVGVNTEQLNVKLGRGDDQMLIVDTSAARARLDGGSGFDSLDFEGVNLLPNLSVLRFEVIS